MATAVQVSVTSETYDAAVTAAERVLQAAKSAVRGKVESAGQIDKVQHGLPPDNFKPMAIVGKGVEEICVTAEDGWFRVMYTARFEDAVHVLHVFQKKTNQTSPQDIELGQKRYRELMEFRQGRLSK